MSVSETVFDLFYGCEKLVLLRLALQGVVEECEYFSFSGSSTVVDCEGFLVGICFSLGLVESFDRMVHEYECLRLSQCFPLAVFLSEKM